ncbi:unnamed protein product [Pylaiella littoralis]
MLLFAVLTVIMALWSLYLHNRMRLVGNEVEALRTEIEGAAASCGKSMN